MKHFSLLRYSRTSRLLTTTSLLLTSLLLGGNALANAPMAFFVYSGSFAADGTLVKKNPTGVIPTITYTIASENEARSTDPRDLGIRFAMTTVRGASVFGTTVTCAVGRGLVGSAYTAGGIYATAYVGWSDSDTCWYGFDPASF